MNRAAGSTATTPPAGERRGVLPARVRLHRQRASAKWCVETFILFEDKVGLQLHEALVAAARRGVQVDMTIDGFGSPDLSHEFIGALTRRRRAHARVRPRQAPASASGINVLRRMHRKIVVVDGELAFVGGINYSADHLADFGPEAKQDYAVEIRGPLVAEIHRFAPRRAGRRASATSAQRHGGAGASRLRTAPRAAAARRHAPRAMFVMRDNRRPHQTTSSATTASPSARRASASSSPTPTSSPATGFIKELRRAARRGVDVRLILQGEPDMPIVKTAAEHAVPPPAAARACASTSTASGRCTARWRWWTTSGPPSARATSTR